MRARYAILLFWVLYASCLYSQTRLETPEMYIGIHGGATASAGMFSPKINGAGNIIQSALVGGNGGAVFRYYGHKYCGLQAELNYMQRGWQEKYDATDTTSAGSYTRRLHYIELPFLMHIYFGSESVRGYLNLGPEIGYCLKEQWSGTKQTTQTAQYGKLDNPFDWGIAAGAGMYVRTKKAGAFQLELRFDFSFGDYFSNRKTAYFSSSHAMDLSLNIGYLWEIKSK